MASRTEHETMIKMTTSKNLLTISTLLFACLIGAGASAAPNLDLETTEKSDSTELASAPVSGSVQAFTARARGPVRLRQRHTQDTASGGSTDTLRRFQPATRGADEASSTYCKPVSNLKRFGGKTHACHIG